MNRTVLFVDDDQSLLDSLLRTVRREPLTALRATNAEEALRILEANPVEVVVSDDQMPGMSGLELVTLIRTRSPRVVSIMLSGHATIGTVVRALNHGQIFRFLLKPCSPDDLIVSLHQALEHRQLLDQCRQMLSMFRCQSSLLVAIERAHPGIIHAYRSRLEQRTNITEGLETIEDLNLGMDVEIKRGNAEFDGPNA
jgi:two-component system, probable response regulator PhcQ